MTLAIGPGMGFDAIARRGVPLTVLVLVGAAAYLQAAGFGHLVGARIAPTESMQRPQVQTNGVRTARHAAESDRDLTATAILYRNPFDSATGPLNGEDATLPAVANSPRLPGADWYADPPCENARAVIITSSDDPDWSFAAVAGADGKTMLRRRGDDLSGSRVEFVGDRRTAKDRDARDRRFYERVWLTASNGARCQMQLGAKPVKTSPPPGNSASADLAKKFRHSGDHETEVDRSVVDSLIANPAELMKVRVVPEKENDRVVGLRLFGIKPDSVLGSLGLENGDRLTSINGFEMSDPQKMLEAYSKLTRADHLTASVVRHGKPVTLDVAIK